MSSTKDDEMSRLHRKNVLFKNFQANYYGSSSGGGRKNGVYSSGVNKFIDFVVSWACSKLVRQCKA